MVGKNANMDITELKPRITVFGVGGGGGNAVNNMVSSGLQGVNFVVANTDAQALMMSKAKQIIQLGSGITEGLGAGSHPEVGRAAAEECIDEITEMLDKTHMCFVTAGMGGGTGTGAAPIIAKIARNKGVLTVGVVTKPFHFEGSRRMRVAESGIEALQETVDTLIVIPNQNLFRIANDKTTFADAFSMADQVLYSGVSCITDLMIKEGLINLDFADVRSVMRNMGRAMMGTGEASGHGRGIQAAEAAVANPLLDEASMKGSQGLLISITGGSDLTLFEVDEAATRIREEVDSEANIILGATFDEALEGVIRVSVVATGIENRLHRDGDDNRDSSLTTHESLKNAKFLNLSSPKLPVEDSHVMHHSVIAENAHCTDNQEDLNNQENSLVGDQNQELFLEEDVVPESSAPHRLISRQRHSDSVEERGVMALIKRIAHSFGLHENIASEEDSVRMKSESTVSYLRERNPSISEESIDDFCVQSKPTVKCEEDKLEIPAFLRRQSH
ncbi:cell division protein FtsZ [Candidatus Liberibacter asiaticus]|uniref:cell division protein FtsZ n=1 Tax=Liberibacter asiaticus TaxID=34021 RepID=UPI0004E04F58|nr:cell division protein FtsZ [Candidatus Liberibacter asiaticus]BAP26943.1 cell division protein FtsZ [Candidatus Liberibacter asiaticus str. Ishi-1]